MQECSSSNHHLVTQASEKSVMQILRYSVMFVGCLLKIINSCSENMFFSTSFFLLFFFVYTLLVCLYTHDGWGLSHRRPLTRPTFRAREKWFDIFHQRECFFFYIFFLLCFIGKTVSRHGRWKRNESDRIFRIMNVCVYAGGSFVLLWWRRWNPGERNIFLLMLPWAMRIGL